MTRLPARRLPLLVAASLALLAGCGGQAAPGATSPTTLTPAPPPIPVVEPTCIADYPQYAGTAAVVDQADAIVRGRATAARDYEIRPEVSEETNPAIDPQVGVPQEEIDQIPGIPATALSFTITEVVKGDLTIGQVIEVNQNTCTTRPLPVGGSTDYLLALSGYGPGAPFSQINDTQAAWQVSGEQTLTPVNPDNDIDVATIDDLSAEASTQAPPG